MNNQIANREATCESADSSTSPVQTDSKANNTAVAAIGGPAPTANEGATPSLHRGATGPRTPLGKSRSRRNALKNGLTAEFLLLESESEDEYRLLVRQLERDFGPVGFTGQWLIRRIARCYLRDRRADIVENAEITRNQRFARPEPNDRANLCVEVMVTYENQKDGVGLMKDLREPMPSNRSQCLQLLQTLKSAIKTSGLDEQRDAPILRTLFGDGTRQDSQHTIRDHYTNCAAGQENIDSLLGHIEHEIRRLELQKAREVEKAVLQRLSASIPGDASMDRLVRYRQSNDRELDRLFRWLELLSEGKGRSGRNRDKRSNQLSLAPRAVEPEGNECDTKDQGLAVPEGLGKDKKNSSNT